MVNFWISSILITFLIIQGYFCLPLLNKAIDLTWPFDENTLRFPGNLIDPFKSKTILKGEFLPGIYAEANSFCQSEHLGTHLDAPSHFEKGNWKVGDIPLERLAGPLVRIDVSNKTKDNWDYAITVEDLKNWESQYGRIPNGAVVIMYSAWGMKFSNQQLYYGFSDNDYKYYSNDSSKTHCPGFGGDAAQWLVDERNIHGVGSDAASLDTCGNPDWIAHRVFLKNRIWGLENVANVEKLPASGYNLYAMVHKIRNGSGGPARVFAMPAKNSAAADSPKYRVVLYSLLLWYSFLYLYYPTFGSFIESSIPFHVRK